MNTDNLSRTMFFRGMTADEIDTALKSLNFHEKSFSKGEAVLLAGNVTDEMGLVLEGGVTIESNDMWGNRTILSHVGPAEFFAETYALLPDEPLMVDVFASENCRILFLNIGSLMHMENSRPWVFKLIRNLLMISTHKNIVLSGRSFNTAPKSARGRIMAYLNSVSLKKKSVEFDIPFDRQQMADYLNLDRTALSKELGKMRDEGIIEFRKNHFRIISEE